MRGTFLALFWWISNKINIVTSYCINTILVTILITMMVFIVNISISEHKNTCIFTLLLTVSDPCIIIDIGNYQSYLNVYQYDRQPS